MFVRSEHEPRAHIVTSMVHAGGGYAAPFWPGSRWPGWRWCGGIRCSLQSRHLVVAAPYDQFKATTLSLNSIGTHQLDDHCKAALLGCKVQRGAALVVDRVD